LGNSALLANVRFRPIADISRSCDDCSMNAKPFDWLRLGLSLFGYAIATIALSLMMNLTGDCAPDVQDCGETARRQSFVVLALGAAWLAYLIVRFVRDHKSLCPLSTGFGRNRPKADVSQSCHTLCDPNSEPTL